MTEAFPLEPALRFLAETALLGIAGWFVFIRLGAARHLAYLGRGARVAFCLFMLSWLGVQLVDRLHLHYPQASSYYPLIRFAMYEAGNPTQTVPGHYVESRLPDGRVVDVDFAAWLPSVDATALDNRFVVLVRWLRTGTEAEASRAAREIAGYASGVRSIMAEAGGPVPKTMSLHATAYRVSDAALVADTVVWTWSDEGLAP